MGSEKLFARPGIRLNPRIWLQGLASSKRLVLVSETGVWKRFGLPILKALKRDKFVIYVHLLPTGEAAKSWGAVEHLMKAMLEAGLGRDSALIALGGGAVTDAAGFAASIYLRGIAWVSIPTTLLGQLDSGLGGKTGINFAGGKNLAGSFYRPHAVVLDSDFLHSLPQRERVSGFGEALKYGLVFDPKLWRLMTNHWPKLMAGDNKLTSQVVRFGAAWKRKIVSQDLYETKGRRELLNFGHTLGHALESTSGLGVLRHGEAVIWGMRAAVKLSVWRAKFSSQVAKQVDQFLKSLPLPSVKNISVDRMLSSVKKDKKVRNGRARFILLKAIGKPTVQFVSDSDIRRAIKELR